MKRILMLGFLVSLSSSCFPQENPLFNVFIPKYWSTGIYYEGTMLEAVSEDESVYFSIKALDTDDLLQAVLRYTMRRSWYLRNTISRGPAKDIEYYDYDLFVLSDIEKL